MNTSNSTKLTGNCVPEPRPSGKSSNPRNELAAILVKKVPGAELSWKFGNASLVIGDKVFAFPSKNNNGLILKLPAHDIAALVETGTARPLVMGKRTMREWVVVDDPLAAATLKLLRAAFTYVDSLPKTAPKKKKK
jgi:predicted DNA-binding protein (MmcQ/YjbR family)